MCLRYIGSNGDLHTRHGDAQVAVNCCDDKDLYYDYDVDFAVGLDAVN